jgi:hypothetical protein
MFVWSGSAWVSVATEVESLANFASLNYVNSYQPTFRNILINGGFAIDQRNSGSSQTFTAAAALAYSVDRWYGYCTGANITGARVAGTAPSQFFYRFTGATSNTGVGFGQRIEAANSFHFANKTAVLSVNLASTSITSVTWTAFYANTTDTFGTLASPTRTQIATGTFTINSTLSRYSAVINVPAAATTGIEIVFTTGALVGSQTLTFDDAQFELGSSPTAFEQRPVGTDLALCQRYCFSHTAGTNYTHRAIDASFLYQGSFYLPTTMRAAPTLRSGATFTVNTGNAGTVGLDGASTQTINLKNNSGNWTTNAAITSTFVVEAEL